MKKSTYNKGIIDRMQHQLFYKYIIEQLEDDLDICYLTCDGLNEMGLMRRAKTKFPDRIIDVGIAEQNLVSIAAGLGRTGMKPYAVTTSSFLALKGCEQIHTDVAYNNISIKLIGIDSGTSSGSGPTHDSICDFAIINAIPNMKIIVPADTKYFIYVLKQIKDMDFPVYLRMPRDEDVEVYKNISEYPFVLGKANVIREGKDVTIIATGKCVANALFAAEILALENINIRVIDMLTIKPFDNEIVIKAAIDTGMILTVEDHNIQGGLGTLVNSAIGKAGVTCIIENLGIPDEFAIYGPREDILKYYELDQEGIVKNIKEMINSRV